jgi:muramoyltetrapeptide carboxypeptidase
VNVKRPPNLAKGDKIGIAAPARKVSEQELEVAFDIIRQYGFEVYYEPVLFSQDRQFAGDDKTRAACFQHLLDREDVKAIISARGGYGSVRIIDKLDFAGFENNPKWIIGYSDITVFHNHINRIFDVKTLHGSMLLNFPQNSQPALSGLFEILRGALPEYTMASHPLNTLGTARGRLAGGNLSVLYSLIGSNSFPDLRNKILFLEDLDEYLYHIDRMMMGLKRAGVLEGVTGVLVGGMTEMNDNEIPFGRTAEEIIAEAVLAYGVPVCFGFPAGHIDDNRPLIMGSTVELDVGEKVQVRFIDD